MGDKGHKHEWKNKVQKRLNEGQINGKLTFHSQFLARLVGRSVIPLMMSQTMQTREDQDGDSKTQIRASTLFSNNMALKRVTGDEAPGRLAC